MNLDSLSQTSKEMKNNLITFIVSLIEELIENKLINEKLARMHSDIEGMQDILVKHFSTQVSHSRNESLCETLDSAEEDVFKKTINAELETIGMRIQQLEYMNHIVMDTQQIIKGNFKELERKVNPLQDQITKSVDEMRRDLKEKQTFQWTVLNDQIERVEKYVQKLKQADAFLSKKSK